MAKKPTSRLTAETLKHDDATRKNITNAEYQQVAGAIKKTATRDLNDLKEKGIVEQRGSRGPGVHYVLARKGDINGTLGT